jgi:hypothetical protein
MPDIVKLIQSPLDRAVIVDAQDNEEGILTGDMGGCYSVVVLWGRNNETGNFQHMRGHHASGGAGNLDWDTLLNGVPNDCAIVGITNPDNQQYDEPRVDAQIDARRPNATKNLCAYTDALVNRTGMAIDNVLPQGGRLASGATHNIRNENAPAIL